jgi:hypothetical protein
MAQAGGVAQTLAVPLESGYVTGTQAGLVRAAVRALLAEVRPDAVALVDAWNFSDHVLGSALGRRDGNVYQALFDWVRATPMHAQPPLCAPGRSRQWVCVSLCVCVCVCVSVPVALTVQGWMGGNRRRRSR